MDEKTDETTTTTVDTAAIEAAASNSSATDQLPGETAAATEQQRIQLPSSADASAVHADEADDEAEEAPKFGVPNLNRAQIVRDGFSLWHWNATALSGSEAQSGQDLDPAADHMETGDVIYITTSDGVLQRSVTVRDHAVVLARLA